MQKNLFELKVKVKITNLPEKYKDGVKIIDMDLTPVELKEGETVKVTLETAQILMEKGISEPV